MTYTPITSSKSASTTVSVAHSQSATDSPVDAAAVRAREYAWMSSSEGVYLNAASTGPMPQCAVEAANKWTQLRAQPHLLPLPLMFDTVAASRAQFAQLVGADVEEIALMPNTTYGLNLAARALPLRPGVILTFDGEFPSCVYPFQALASRGISLELIPRVNGLPDEETLIKKIARPDVVAVVISWVQFATGFVADLKRIGEACRANGVFFIVDAIQGTGIREIDLHALHVDIFASGAQKWQLSPWGTGFVYVRRALIESMQPHDVGWACMRASTDYTRLTDYEFDFFPDARRFEVVTLAYHDFAVANASTEMILGLGVRNVSSHIEALVGRIVQWAESRADIRLVSPAAPERRAGVAAFAPKDVLAMSARLREGKVTHVTREGAIRLSPHCYNTMDEIDSVLRLLET